ncbi:MAG: Gfo/Idh/MocA family oxidoreductase [Chloroflexota bacterium]|nr:Gfo/Idh/MocA family oxidoreductase [Chloroflexota bacterium]
MTIDLAEADRMIAAARRAGARFGMIFQRRFWLAARHIRAALDAGKLGEVTLGECAVRLWHPEGYFAADPCRGKWSTEGGEALMNQAVHAIDLFQWFIGPAVEVCRRCAAQRYGASSTWRIRRRPRSRRRPWRSAPSASPPTAPPARRGMRSIVARFLIRCGGRVQR